MVPEDSTTKRQCGSPASRVASSVVSSLCCFSMNLSIIRQVQRGIIGSTLGLETGGQVLVRVAVAICSDDPNLLATQLLMQILEHANLVGNAVEALAT